MISHTQTTTATTAQVGPDLGAGFVVAVLTIGVGLSAAVGGVVSAATGRQYSDVFTYGGYYHNGPEAERDYLS